MSKDKYIGILLIAVSAIVIVLYGYILFLTSYSGILIELTAFIAILGIFGIVGWIGYTLATTPPPKPIEEIEKEIDEELKKLEQEQNVEQKTRSEGNAQGEKKENIVGNYSDQTAKAVEQKEVSSLLKDEEKDSNSGKGNEDAVDEVVKKEKGHIRKSRKSKKS
jgi:predicted DNA-binding transcriptional regulator